METCFKILQLKFDQKLTNRCIGLTLHISASTVFEVLARFKASYLSWPLPADISHDTLEKLIFPPKDTSASELVMPDMLYFDMEMRKPGVTRQLLWMEYKAQAGDKSDGILALLPLLPGVEKNATPLHAPGAPRWRKALYRLLWFYGSCY